MPKKSRLKTNVGVNADTVARYKYVSRGGKVDGFYSGNTFANQLGISTQVPNKVEIVSNNMAAKSTRSSNMRDPSSSEKTPQYLKYYDTHP